MDLVEKELVNRRVGGWMQRKFKYEMASEA
jgi:hypothetical protein